MSRWHVGIPKMMCRFETLCLAQQKYVNEGEAEEHDIREVANSCEARKYLSIVSTDQQCSHAYPCNMVAY
jgi:hypothetical protein